MSDELAEHLDPLARDGCYRVDAVLKRSPSETTQRVYFVGANGSEQGPYVRKYLEGEGLGAAYERIWKAQRAGRRFLHLPSVLECYTVGERRIVVMEHVRGETLAEAVYRRDPSVALAREVFPPLCDAVSELHEGFDPPLIHRDLKPSNVMLAPGGLALIDFGIARSFNEGAETDTRHLGTRAYAPPEQFGFGQTDERSDVYALGLLLYFCLTERTPDAEARARGYACAEVPEALRAVIRRAAELDPAERYQSAAEAKRAFLEAVGALEAGSSAPVFPPAPDPASRVGGDAPVGLPPCGAASSEFSGALPGKDACAPSGMLPDGAHGEGLLRRKGFWDGRSAAAGAAWNVVVLAATLLFLAVSVGIVLFPTPGSAAEAMPAARRAISYSALFVFVFCPVFYLVSDRRPLKRRLSALARLTRGQELAAFVLCEVVGFIVIGFASSAFPAG